MRYVRIRVWKGIGKYSMRGRCDSSRERTLGKFTGFWRRAAEYKELGSSFYLGGVL